MGSYDYMERVRAGLRQDTATTERLLPIRRTGGFRV